jgi:peptidyl-prolyl cis-trans isomerase C
MPSRLRKTGVLVLSFGFLILLFLGCEQLQKLPLALKNKITPPPGTVIAGVGDLYITSEQLDQEIKNYNDLTDNPEARITTRDQKLTYLNDELVRRYLLYLEAKARRLDGQPKTQEMLRNAEINILANQLLQNEVGNLTVTSSEVEDFYNLYKEQYRQEEERNIREIIVDTETEAKDILIELLKGSDFATLATQRSRAASATKGGDLGFIKKGQRGPDFARFDEIAFSRSLDLAQTSNVFKGKDGYYLIKVEGIRGGQAKSISEVWDDIKRNVLFLKQQQKLQDITNSLLKKTKVVIYDGKIK